MRKLAGISLTAVLLLSLSGESASALVITPNPIPLIGTGGLGGSIVASLELVATSTGIPVGGVVSFGSVAPTTTSLVFRVTVDASSAPVFYFLVAAEATFPLVPPLLAFSGAGVIPGPDADVALTNIPTDPSVKVTGPSAAGDVSDLFFISYPTPPAVGQFVLGGVDEVDFFFGACGPSPCVQNHATVVPEPGSSELLAVGLTGLALLRRPVRRWFFAPTPRRSWPPSRRKMTPGSSITETTSGPIASRE